MPEPPETTTPPEGGPERSGQPVDRPGRTARARAQAERARAQAARLRERADATVKGLEARRPANRYIDAAFATFERDMTSGGGVLAAALAFRIFIFLVPFVFVVVTAIPVLSDPADADPTRVADRWGMTGLAATAIEGADGLSFWSRLSLLAAGIIALVLASRSLVRVLRITHGLAWHTRVPKLRAPTRAGLILVAAVAGFVVLGSLTSRLQDRFGALGLVPMLFSGLLVAAIWTLVQTFLPNPGVHWTNLVPGALLVGLGTEVLHLATVLWFTRYLESKSETYGAIGAALAILLWAYFLGRIIVTGAMLNATLHEQDPAPTGEGHVDG